jgi:NAD(P)-dependent dehydrogenase (short-subunit alcohol dehydrogenase family)
MMQKFKFEGSAAAITGAASGIGRALAFELAARGCDVALADLDEAGLQSAAKEISATHGRRVMARTVDVADPKQIQDFASSAVAEFPALNIVINNAGVALLGRRWRG